MSKSPTVKEIKKELTELGVDYDDKLNKDELLEMLEEHENTEEDPQADQESDSDDNLEELETKKYVVIHDFKDLEDRDIVYIKDDIYPKRADSEISEERFHELMSSDNKIGKPLIKEQE